MEYEKKLNLLDNTTNQPSKFSTRNWIETNNESRGMYDNSSTKSNTSMIRSDVIIVLHTYLLVEV